MALVGGRDLYVMCGYAGGGREKGRRQQYHRDVWRLRLDPAAPQRCPELRRLGLAAGGGAAAAAAGKPRAATPPRQAAGAAAGRTLKRRSPAGARDASLEVRPAAAAAGGPAPAAANAGGWKRARPAAGGGGANAAARRAGASAAAGQPPQSPQHDLAQHPLLRQPGGAWGGSRRATPEAPGYGEDAGSAPTPGGLPASPVVAAGLLSAAPAAGAAAAALTAAVAAATAAPGGAASAPTRQRPRSPEYEQGRADGFLEGGQAAAQCGERGRAAVESKQRETPHH
jgi:hypothetical protein